MRRCQKHVPRRVYGTAWATGGFPHSDANDSLGFVLPSSFFEVLLDFAYGGLVPGEEQLDRHAAELFELANEMREARERGKILGLTDVEEAYYGALEVVLVGCGERVGSVSRVHPSIHRNEG